ncbi:MAG: LysR family transcriptional regulator [Eubacteriales bacterium]|nr:LysR family transcriptional regulator [Eubacteriales bacterium]
MINPLIKSFIIVVDTGSFSKAGEQLFLSSTAVMKQMNQLEAHIGLPLLVRTNHGIKMTEAGESLYEDAKFMLRYSEQAIGRAYTRQLKEQYTIRLGSSMLYPSKTLIELWNKVSSSYPQFKLRIVPFEDSMETEEEVLGTGSIDVIAGAFGVSEWGNLSFLHISDYHFAVAMPLGHPLAEKKFLSYEDLHGEKLMIMPRGHSPMNDHIRDDIENEHPEIALEDAPRHYNVNTFNQCEEDGNLLLTLDGWKDIHPSLVTIPLKVPYTLPYGIISAKEPNEATKLFLGIVRQLYTNQ